MAGEWEEVPLGDVITLQRGFDLPSQDRKPGKVPIVSSSGISDYHSDVGVIGPGVVTGRYGTIGQVFLIKDDYWPLNTTLWVKDFHGNDPQFASYLLRTVDFRSCSDKSSVPGVNRNDLHRIPVLRPPLAEQKAIAAVLGVLDDKIELNRRMNATLEAMARALFQSWFVDFDPVRAKLDGRQPTGLDQATAALFPATFQDSPLGPIPRGWTAKPLPEAVEVNPRRTLKAGTIAPYLDMKNLPTQGHSADEVVGREFSSGTKFHNGDTLLARITPCLENGKTGYVDFLADGQVGWGSTEYIVFAPKPPLPPQFGYLLARSDALRTHAIQNMTGTSGRQRVPSECFSNFQLAVPTPAIAHRFDELTAPLMAKIKANSNESRTLATLRDTLLPKLLRGELTVPQAERCTA
ncbi:MAG: restriction endonuclease subunit S [Planctomycetes bacterium]|nr:restriction endonuclease subunit S [Planctomycetota bacterium]